MFGGEPRRRRRGGPGRRRPGDVPGQGGGAQPDRPLRGPGRRAQAGAQRGQTTSARIRDALTQDRLSLATQPIRSLASGGIERYELLLRMTGESGELLPAASFIEVAERSGMVQELDRWVVGQALELLAERERAGEPVSLHVNLSGASLTDISVLEFIERRLDEGDADPGALHLRDHPDRPGRGLRDGRRLRRPPHRVRLRSRDRRLRRRLRPLPLPEADPLRRDQDRRRLRPRHAPQRRRPADREGDRPDRPRPRQDDDRRVRPGRRDDARCCASTASTWPRATTWAARSTRPRVCCPRPLAG